MTTDDARAKNMKKPFLLIEKPTMVESIVSRKNLTSILKIDGKEMMKFDKASDGLIYVFCLYYVFNLHYELSRKDLCIFLERTVFKWRCTKEITESVKSVMDKVFTSPHSNRHRSINMEIIMFFDSSEMLPGFLAHSYLCIGNDSGFIGAFLFMYRK